MKSWEIYLIIAMQTVLSVAAFFGAEYAVTTRAMVSNLSGVVLHLVHDGRP